MRHDQPACPSRWRSTVWAKVMSSHRRPMAVVDHDVADPQRVGEGDLQARDHVAEKRPGGDGDEHAKGAGGGEGST